MLLPVLAAALLAASPAARKDPLVGLDQRLSRGEWAALRGELERALEGARGDRRAAVLVALGRVAHQASTYHRHDPQGAEAAVMRAADAAREAGGATGARARLLEGQLRYWQGFADPPRWDAAQRVLDDARARAGEAKDARLEAEAIFYLGLVAQQQGRWDAARPLFEDALRRATRAKDPFLASFPERHLASLDEEERRDLARAEAGYRRSLALRERAGATAFLPFARIALADVLVAAGREREALPLLEQAVAEGARSGSRRGEAMAALGLFAVRGKLGDAAGAREAAARALAAAQAFGDPELVAEAERAAEGGQAER